MTSVSVAFLRPHNNLKFLSNSKYRLLVAASDESLKDYLILFTDSITNLLNIQNIEFKEELKKMKAENKEELQMLGNKLKENNEELQILGTNLKENKEELQMLGTNLKENKEELQMLGTKLKENKEELQMLGTKLSNIVDTYGVKWEQASDTYEIMARTQIRKRFPNAKVVSCQSLRQLAEICLPNDYNFESDQIFTDKNKNGALPIAAVEKRVQLLLKIARKQIPILRSWMESAEEMIATEKKKAGKDTTKKLKTNPIISMSERKVNVLRQELEDYDRCSAKSKTLYLRTSRLGFFAYSTVLIANQTTFGFIEELEVDFLRLPTLVIDKITHFAGEVKFGKGARKDAMVQALRRVGVFYMAGKHILGKKHKKFTFEGHGQIASPRDWQDPTRDEINNLKNDAGILEYPSRLYVVMERYFGMED